jgi:hypothetical protein
MAELVGGLQPNAANQLKRGGFLECAEQANPLPSWLDVPHPRFASAQISPVHSPISSGVPIAMPSRKPARLNSHATFSRRLAIRSTVSFVERIESV